ncbi:hypothetical protein VTJ04DRAFT_8066 [Mycothermus thermophilus]|uniref:uncharacterized protein n=1 Tax=Humicola insolens TaxID=85995 RepID=UPI0037425994
MANTSPTNPTAPLPFKMHITPDNTGLWRIRQTEEAARTVTELLQKDMENHHVFFNQDGYHNHIPHHLLALYGTGADPAALRAAYSHNESYQRPVMPSHRDDLPVVPFLPWPAAAQPYLSKEEYYPDFLRFFQSETSRLGGWREVVGRYLLGLDMGGKGGSQGLGSRGVEEKRGGAGGGVGGVVLGEERGKKEDSPLLVRLFAGFLHPMIQLMYGIEWAQEAVVAEGLAQTAVHSADIGEFLMAAEELAEKKYRKEKDSGQQQQKRESVLSLLTEVRSNPKLATAARMSDANKIRDGVMARAKEEMLAVAAKVRVMPGEVEERTAEMLQAALFMATAAALERTPGKKPARIDFFLMHHVTSSPFFITLNAQPWVPAASKARLLEWKIRMDLLQYAARGAPELSVDKLANYQPKHHPDATGEPPKGPADIISRLHTIPDDGHSIKLGRAAVICHDICRKFEDDPHHQPHDWLVIRGDDMWRRVCHLIVDSVEVTSGPRWVRSTGFEEAWKDVPDVEG